MSNFHKHVDSESAICGTKVRNNLPYISSGMPSLDHIIGGGLPSGGIFAVEEDVLGSYSRVLIKYFLAEGVVSKHDLFIATADEPPGDIVKELPQCCNAPTEDDVKEVQTNMDSMKIAFRYEGLKPVESSFGANSNLGHHFDLSKYIEEDTIKNCNITLYNPCLAVVGDVTAFKNPMYHNLLSKIRTAVSKEQYQSSSKNRNILRISIQSLGSPIWMAEECDHHSVANYGHDLVKFMYCLRIILRDSTASAFITIPAHLFDDDHLMKRLLYSIDNAVRIESFAGSSRETNPVYKDYHGLFHITKLSAVYSLVPYVPPSLDLAFKLRRKKFIIEKLHLPPELQETSEREQDDITATPPATCGGFKKKDIDF